MAETPTASPASARVVAVTELLEAILLEVPERDLLLAQRVNQKFHQTITKSVSIQRKLFFEVDNNETDKSSTEPAFNPLLEYMFAKGYWKERTKYAIISSCDSLGDAKTCVHLPIVGPFAHMHRSTEATGAQLYEKASWRRMWPSRPALVIHPMGENFWYHANEVPATKMEGIMKVLSEKDTLDQANRRGDLEFAEHDEEDDGDYNDNASWDEAMYNYFDRRDIYDYSYGEHEDYNDCMYRGD